MNQGRIWCVVNPSVGLPLFLGSVALTSLAVHASVMTHTTWMSSFFSGSSKAKVSLQETAQPQIASVAPASNPAFTITVAPAAAASGNNEAAFVVTVTPNATVAATQATVDQPARLALAPSAVK